MCLCVARESYTSSVSRYFTTSPSASRLWIGPRAAAIGLSIGDVVEAARGAHSTASAGYLADVEHRELPIRQMARVGDVSDIERTLVRQDGGTPITIGDVATVRLAAAQAALALADAGNAAERALVLDGARDAAA